MDMTCKTPGQTARIVKEATGSDTVERLVMPKIRLCWMCNRQFRGNHFTTRTVQGHERELHKACAEDYDKDPDY
jgi:hypothetical protein